MLIEHAFLCLKCIKRFKLDLIQIILKERAWLRNEINIERLSIATRDRVKRVKAIKKVNTHNCG